MTEENNTNNETDNGKVVVQEIKAGDVKALPQWAQDIISSTRAEAANWRTQLREAQTDLAKAKSPEDVEAALTAMSEKNKMLERDLLVERIAAKHGLPDDLKSRLKGDDEKALETDAAALAKFVPKPETERIDPDTLKGGMDPDTDADANFDPVAVAKNARANRY